MSDDTFYRAYWLRQHRIIGQYLAVQAWIRGLDCIVLDRWELEVFLGLCRFKKKHVDWLQEDLRPWFPFQETFTATKNPSSLHSVFLSRVPISEHVSMNNMTTEKRIAAMSPAAPKTGLLMDKKWLRKLPREGEMLAQLANLSFGVITPDDLRPRKRERGKKAAQRQYSFDPMVIIRMMSKKKPDP